MPRLTKMAEWEWTDENDHDYGGFPPWVLVDHEQAMKQSIRGGAASWNKMKPIYTNAYLFFALVRFDPTM